MCFFDRFITAPNCGLDVSMRYPEELEAQIRSHQGELVAL
jgi:hypothetical protein